MPDENNTQKLEGADTSAANKQNEGANTNADTSTANQNEGKTETKTFTQEDVNRLIAKERKDVERKAKLSEDERLKADLDDARNQLRTRDTKDAVLEAAAKLGARNTNLIYKAVKDDLTFDKDGKPENLKDVLAQAKKDFPELFGDSAHVGSADAGSGRAQTNGSKVTMNDWLRQ